MSAIENVTKNVPILVIRGLFVKALSYSWKIITGALIAEFSFFFRFIKKLGLIVSIGTDLECTY